jgi:hypothetical protein
MNESVCVTSGAQMPILEIDVALREQISPKSLGRIRPASLSTVLRRILEARKIPRRRLDHLVDLSALYAHARIPQDAVPALSVNPQSQMLSLFIDLVLADPFHSDGRHAPCRSEPPQPCPIETWTTANSAPATPEHYVFCANLRTDFDLGASECEVHHRCPWGLCALIRGPPPHGKIEGICRRYGNVHVELHWGKPAGAKLWVGIHRKAVRRRVHRGGAVRASLCRRYSKYSGLTCDASTSSMTGRK